MNIFFRTNASFAEKVYTATFMCFCVVMIYGLLQGFQPFPETMLYGSYAAIPLCLILAVPAILDRHPNNKIHSGGILGKIVFYPLILLFSYLMTFGFIVLSAPAIYTKLLGTEETASFQILEKSSGAWKKRCQYSFQIKDIDSEFTTKFCTTRDGWQNLNEGTTVKGSVKHSMFGKIVRQLEP